MAEPLHLTDDNFQQEVLESTQPVLVDFGAVWCGPCRLLDPIMDELAVAYEGKAKIGKIDVDESQQVATTYGVRSMPTILLFKDGRVVDTLIGAVSRKHIVDKLKRHTEDAFA